MVRSIERRLQIRRSLALAMVIVLVVAAANLLIVAFGPRAINEARDFGSDIPGVVERLGELPVVGGRLRQADASAKVATWLEDLPSKLSNDPEPLVSLTRAVLGGALAAFVTVLVTVALLLDGRRLASTARRLVPDGRRARFDRTLDVVYRTVGPLLRRQPAAGLAHRHRPVRRRADHRRAAHPMLAVWAAMTNLIPQVGGFLGGSMFVLLGLTESPARRWPASSTSWCGKQIENHVLHPTIVGDAVNLSPPAHHARRPWWAGPARRWVAPGALVAVPLLGAAKSILLELRPDLAGPPRVRRTPVWRRVRDRLSRPDPAGNR